jgi:hypothetical protein
MEEVQLTRIQKLNLLWVVIITIGISSVLVLLSFTIFLKSGAYDTVQQISAAENVLATSVEGIDTTSPIQASDLEEYAQSLPQRVKLLNDAEDFSKISL